LRIANAAFAMQKHELSRILPLDYLRADSVARFLPTPPMGDIMVHDAFLPSVIGAGEGEEHLH
jgi:hypothetical protein